MYLYQRRKPSYVSRSQSPPCHLHIPSRAQLSEIDQQGCSVRLRDRKDASLEHKDGDQSRNDIGKDDCHDASCVVVR